MLIVLCQTQSIHTRLHYHSTQPFLTSFHFRELLPISEDFILTSYEGKDSPQTARLEGVPGAGKTTFLKHLVHKWSQKFLKFTGDQVTVYVGDGQFSTMVYLHVRSIKGSVREAIRSALWCRKEDKDVLMKHVETGDGVAILIDATDELRDEAIIAELKDYVDGQTGGCQKILVSSRTDLCCIDIEKFDRLLVLQGFTLPQAMDYVASYFPSEDDPTRTYINNHQHELEPILTNPLRLNILCELTSRGLLKLKLGETLDLLTLFIPLEKHLIRREIEKRSQYHKDGAEGSLQVTDEDGKQFYRMCLYGLLTDVRSFTDQHLKDFKTSEIYRDAFLNKSHELDVYANPKVCYTFRHEMLYEVFSALHFFTATEESLKLLLLAICMRKSLRNVQKIVCEILSKKELKKGNLLLGTIRAILVLQVEGQAEGHPLTEEQQNLQKSMSPSVEQLLQSQQTKEQVTMANVKWDEIKKAFDQLTQGPKAANFPHSMIVTGGFYNLQDNGTINHVFDCLQSCSKHQHEEVIRHTVHCLLPCTRIKNG